MTAEEIHHMQVAPMTNGSRNVRYVENSTPNMHIPHMASTANFLMISRSKLPDCPGGQDCNISNEAQQADRQDAKQDRVLAGLNFLTASQWTTHHWSACRFNKRQVTRHDESAKDCNGDRPLIPVSDQRMG